MTAWGTLDVYATKTGHAFHETPDCRALTAGQGLNDWECGCDEYCRHRSPQLHVVQPVSIPEAMGAAKMPCLVCLPGLGASWYRTPSERDFGHEPVDHCGDVICGRCRTHHVDEDGEHYSLPAFWPCTSALVLGLVPRPGICPGCGAPMDPPPPGSTKCPPCDDNDRLDALGAAL